MKYNLFLVFILSLFFGNYGFPQEPDTEVVVVPDSLAIGLFDKGARVVNQCTPWHHLKCVYITGTEVYKDGRAGKKTRHFWRMSYIGRACTDKYGKTFGKIFEAIFVIPHYTGIAIGNGVGLLVRLVRGSEEKVAARKLKRKAKREARKLKREQERN